MNFLHVVAVVVVVVLVVVLVVVVVAAAAAVAAFAFIHFKISPNHGFPQGFFWFKGTKPRMKTK